MKLGIVFAALVSALCGCVHPGNGDTMPSTVYVSGEVGEQGCYAARKGMTLREVVTAAGGFSDRANSVRVERNSNIVFRANIRDSIDFPVEHEDEIVVEKTE